MSEPFAAASQDLDGQRPVTVSAWAAVGQALQFEGERKQVLQAARYRLIALLSIFMAGFFVLGLRAVEVAILSPHAPSASTYAAAEVPRRADVLDRHGQLLATTLTTYSLFVDPSQVWDPRETREAILTVLPDLDVAKLDEALGGKGRFQWVARNLTPKQKQAIFELGQPSLDFKLEERRIYPRNTLAAHAMGYAGVDNKGLSGAELAFDQEILAGGESGQPFQLSLDVRVQNALDDELRQAMDKHQAKGAVGIISDITTGEILALTSLPDYDLNDPQSAEGAAQFNRAARGVYEMGSTFKIFTVAMGLDEGVVTLEDSYDATKPLKIGGRVIHDYHAENRQLTVEEIFTHSSNIGTAQLALDAGPKTLQKFLKQLGLFDAADVELVESARPLLPKKWNDSTAASVSFGHAMSVSPLALTAAINALMNTGRYVPLTLKKRGAHEDVQGRQVVSAETSHAMLQLMRANVVRGSGSKADVPGYRVGGKTGTAEKSGAGGYDRDRLLSSFAAVYPTDAPKYSVLVILDEPKGLPETYGYATGGWTAAPVVGRVIARTASFLGVERRFDVPEPAKAQSLAQWRAQNDAIAQAVTGGR